MASVAAREQMPVELPVGRRTPRGKLRWYLVRVPEGRAQSTCDKVRKLVSPDALDDAFVIFKECWRKRDGEWVLVPQQMYDEYFFVATKDVTALDGELSRLSFPAQIAGSELHSFAPLSAEAQEWFESALDGDHVLRNSEAVIVDGVLRIQDGPLVGQEARVRKIDRHKRNCRVSVCERSGESFTQVMPLNVPVKS